jgi:hypothetical protein
VRTQGPLLGGGGALTGDLTLTLTPASAAEATAGAANDRVVTPASLSAILATLAGKAAGATVSAGGLLKGGNRIDANPVLWLDAASPEDIVAGTASDRAVTPAALAGLPRSLTPNGWITLPGGIRLMWVQVRQTITTEASFTAVYPDSFTEFVVPSRSQDGTRCSQARATCGWRWAAHRPVELSGPDPILQHQRDAHRRLQPVPAREMTMAKITTAPRAAASSTRRTTPTCPKTQCASPRCTMPG